MRRQKILSQEKDTHAIIRREFSASRMNTTKWREVAGALGGLGIFCRIKFVDQPKVFDLPNFWHVTGDWLDCGTLGPFTSVSIEWLEIDPMETISRGLLLEPSLVDHLQEIERRLQEASIPYHLEAGRLFIIGHVRKAPVSSASEGAA